MLPAAAQDADSILEEVVPAPTLGTQDPLDIGPLLWRIGGGHGAQMASRDLDDSSWVARSAVGSDFLMNRVAWYRFHFRIAPEGEGLGSELRLAGVEGNVAAYLNGREVGEMRGAVDPPYRRGTTFLLPSSSLRIGDNVLALRLSGFTGEPLVGIPRGPIVLSPLSAAYEQQDRAKEGRLQAEREAVRLAAEATDRLFADPSQSPADRSKSSQPDEVLASMASSAGAPESGLPFGRFGAPGQVGLLTCQLGPHGFESAASRLVRRPLKGTFGLPSAAEHVDLESLSPVGKVQQIDQGHGVRYRLYYPLLYPGFAIRPQGSALRVHLDAPLEALYVDRWGITTHSAQVTAPLPWVEPWVCLYDPGGQSAPLLVALPSPTWHLGLVRSKGGGVDLELPAGAIARFCWPWGIAPHLPTLSSADMARLRRWSDAMVPFARHGDDRVEDVSGGGRTVLRLEADDRFGYLDAGSIPYAPVPPALTFALPPAAPIGVSPRDQREGDSGLAGEGAPAGGEAGGFSWTRLLARLTRRPDRPSGRGVRYRDLGVPTLAGPLWAATGTAQVRYSLAVPTTSAWQLRPSAISPVPSSQAITRQVVTSQVASREAGGTSQATDSSVPQLALATARSAADLAFTARVSAYLHWSDLTEVARQTLEANTAAQIPRAWGPDSWALSIEPQTGTPFWWTSARLDGDGQLGDYGLGNGLALYGTSVAALVGGDWGAVREGWASMERAFAWFEDSFDWAWQASCASERGGSTGDGQTLTAGYLGALGMARMAQVIDPSAADGYLALAARMGAVVATRPDLTLWARRHGLLDRGQVAIGYTAGGIAPGRGPMDLFGSLAGLPELADLPGGALGEVASKAPPRPYSR